MTITEPAAEPAEVGTIDRFVYLLTERPQDYGDAPVSTGIATLDYAVANAWADQDVTGSRSYETLVLATTLKQAHEYYDLGPDEEDDGSEIISDLI